MTTPAPSAKGGRPGSRRPIREIVTDLDLQAQHCDQRCPRCTGVIRAGVEHQCAHHKATP